VFSLIFGAGAIFVLAWNASVIAAAVGIFAKSNLSDLPLGIARFMIHGLPEIAAYFIAALAGGIVSVAVIKHDIRSEKFWNILQDSLNLLILAVIVLFIAALIEVFITPKLF
jgi:stage II sporulation protein M